MSAAATRKAWKRYEEILARHSAKSVASLRPPASEQTIADAEAVLGFPLHEDVRELYRLHDGLQADALPDDTAQTPFAVCYFIPLIEGVDSAVSDRSSWIDMVRESDLVDALPSIDYAQKMLPFAKDFGGNSLFASCAPGTSEVWRFDHGNGVVLLRIGMNLLEFLEKERSYVERGLSSDHLINEDDDYRYLSSPD